jgi:hypothetical protein
MESKDYERYSEAITILPAHVAPVRLCTECADFMVFFSVLYMEYIKGFAPIRYRYCLCISPHLILIYLQARVFQQPHAVIIAYPFGSSKGYARASNLVNKSGSKPQLECTPQGKPANQDQIPV